MVKVTCAETDSMISFLTTLRKRTFNNLAAISLVICVLTLALWSRSFMAVDLFQLDLPSHSVHTVESNAGVLQFTWRWWPQASKPVPFGVFHEVLSSYPTGGWGPQFAFFPGNPNGYYEAWQRLRLPFWAVFLLTGVLPMCWLVRAVSSSELRKAGCCHVCGYDLRATPHRCPECGTPTAACLATN
jgi:hypothetical protein